MFKQKLLKCKRTIQIATFNIRTLNKTGQLPELASSAIDHDIDIICIQEHRYTHSEDIKYHNTANGLMHLHWKILSRATIGGVGILIGPQTLKSLNSIEKIQPRMMVATFKNKKPRGNNIICQLYQSLWLHSQRKDGANSTHLWPTKKNCHSHNDAV